jgi:succinate dehydrogenase / fumarate reductase flavoprotein subunit
MPFDRNPTTARSTSARSAATPPNFGDKPVQRACAAADRTGHAMLHTLYQQQRRVRAPSSSSNGWRSTSIRDADGDVRRRDRARDGDRRGA